MEFVWCFLSYDGTTISHELTGRRPQRKNPIFYHIRGYMLLTWLILVDIDFDHFELVFFTFLNLHFHHSLFPYCPLWSTAGWRGYISDLYQLILLYRSVPPPSGLPCSRVILTLTSPWFNQDTSFHSSGWPWASLPFHYAQLPSSTTHLTMT